MDSTSSPSTLSEVEGSILDVSSSIRHRASSIPLFLSFFLVFLPHASAEDIGKHMLSRIEQKAFLVHSYKANFDLWLRLEDKEVRLSGTLLYKWPKRLRTEMSLSEQKTLSQVIYWKDGMMWQYLPSAGTAFRQNEEALRQKFPDTFASQDLLNLQNPFDLIEPHSVKFVDEERENGKAVYLFEGVPKTAIRHQGVLQPVLCRMKVSEENGLLEEMVMRDKAGEEIMKQRFWDIQVNPELLDEEFIFNPEHVTLVEITKETEKKMALFLKEEITP